MNRMILPLALLASSCLAGPIIDRMDLRSAARVELPARMVVSMPADGLITFVCYGARIEFDGWMDIVMAVEDVTDNYRRIERTYRLNTVGKGLATLNFFDTYLPVERGMPLAFVLEESGRSEDFSGSLSLVRHGDGFALGVYGQGPQTPAAPEPAGVMGALVMAVWLYWRGERSGQTVGR